MDMEGIATRTLTWKGRLSMIDTATVDFSLNRLKCLRKSISNLTTREWG